MPLNNRSRLRPARSGPAVVALALAVLLSACAGASDPGGASTPAAKNTGIASIAKPTSGTDPTGPTEQERPLLRTDMSQADQRRLYVIYNACLQAQGLDITNKAALSSKPEKVEKAEKACLSKQPEEVPERAERADPATYPDKMRAWAACLTTGGYKAHVRQGNIIKYDKGFEPGLINDDKIYAKWHRVDQKCQKRVFGM